MGVGRQGWGGHSLFLSFSHRQLALQPRATKGNQAVGDAMPLFLECLQPHQVIYNPRGCARINNPMVYRHPRHPRGVGSWIHYSFVIFFSSQRTESCYGSQATYKKCVCVVSQSASAVLQFKTSRRNETKQKTKQNIKTHRNNRNNPEKPSELR